MSEQKRVLVCCRLTDMSEPAGSWEEMRESVRRQ